MRRTGQWIMLLMLLAFGIFALRTDIALGQFGADFTKLADKLVNQCAGIHEGDLVLVQGGVRDAKLLEDIAIDCRKLGAFPGIILGSDRMIKLYFKDVPPKYDSQVPQFDLLLANNITATIGVDYSESTGVLEGVPQTRRMAVSNAYAAIEETYIKRSIRQVYLGNGLYPTSSTARLYGLTQEQLSRIFWDGVNVDYTALQATADKVKNILTAGKEVRITNPSGTDLKVIITGKPAFSSDGVISADDVKKGGANCVAYLPAGEVYLAPVPGTAEGKVVIDRQLYQGKEIMGLTLIFKAGKLTSMTAKSGLEPFKAAYDAADSSKSELSFIDVGINPNVKLAPGSMLDAWMASGMVIIGMGNNTWVGGDNKSVFSSSHFLHGATLKVDGKALVEDGALKL
jgi:leucyl aminopeptidase (aminopeptidase T)